jgi:hypothetical protein
MANKWKDNEDLWKSSGSLEKLLYQTPQSSHFTVLMSAGQALWTQYERTNVQDHLDRAISTNERALAQLPANGFGVDQVHLDAVRRNLFTALSCRFMNARTTTDISRVITLGEQLVTSCPPEHRRLRAKRLNDLGIALSLRYRLTNSVDDITRSIETLEKALELNSIDKSDAGPLMFSIGEGLHVRFRATNNIEDLNKAILWLKQAAANTSPTGPYHALVIIELGEQLHRRSEETSDMDDLYEAIDVMEEGLGRISKADPHYQQLSKALDSAKAWRKWYPGFDRQMTGLENAVGIFRPHVKPKRKW